MAGVAWESVIEDEEVGTGEEVEDSEQAAPTCGEGGRMYIYVYTYIYTYIFISQPPAVSLSACV